jgi:hypothetical protein
MTTRSADRLGDEYPPVRSTGRWSQDRRLEFIDFRLRWDGKINRSDLTDFFGLSVPQASLDIAKYTELAPKNLNYDRSCRTYVATQTFRPVFPSSSTGRFLSELLAQAADLDGARASFVAWAPPVATVPSPGRTFQVDVLVALLKAIRERIAVQVTYQSLTRPQPTTRTLSPHALAHDGFRWHVRAYCHSREDFRDFVIARMLSFEGFAECGDEAAKDVEWHTIVPLVLTPHPKLSQSHRLAIELDYGMEQGQVEFHCRQAFLFYALRHLRLDETASARPEAQQIELKNRADVDRYMRASSGDKRV